MSKIEWTGKTWNPVVGCTVTSPGCKNCYAMKMAHRITKMQPDSHYQDTTIKVNGKAVWTGKISTAPDHKWLEPLKRKKPTTYFVNSMGDLFHPNVPDKMIDRVFALMAFCPQHTFQVLTKSADRMRKYFDSTRKHKIAHSILDNHSAFGVNGENMLECLEPMESEESGEWVKLPLKNVWLGVSVEDQKRADERRDPIYQLSCDGWLTFVSYEPALGPVDWERYSFIDWMICGGESGKGARPMHPDWARAAREFCKYYGIPFFFKQWGEWVTYIDREKDDPDWQQNYTTSKSFQIINLAGGFGFHGNRVHQMQRVGKKAAGRVLDGTTHTGFPS